ncbi:hypothetical protein JCM3770_002533 [Rhodotorula araucariae]
MPPPDPPRPPRDAPPASALHSAQGQRPSRERPQYAHAASSSSSVAGKARAGAPAAFDPAGRPGMPTVAYDSSYSVKSTSTAADSLPGHKVQFSRAHVEPAAPSVYGDSASQANVPLVSYSSSLAVPGASATTSSVTPGMSAASGTDFRRKRSLVRPDRERVDESHRLYNYRQHAAAMELEGRGTAAVSRTGHSATAGLPIPVGPAELSGAAPAVAQSQAYALPAGAITGADAGSTTLRRGKSILAREEDAASETGLNLFKRGGTVRRPGANKLGKNAHPGGAYDRAQKAKQQKKPLSAWMIYCKIVTACFPAPVLRCFGFTTKDRQSAWREKIGLLSIIAICMALVGFLTFGFTQSVCGTPSLRYRAGNIDTGSMIFHGYNYDMDGFRHPAAAGISEGSNPLYDVFDAGGKDGSFLFQKVNQKCLGIITPASGTGITHKGDEMGWYFPCNLYNQWGTSVRNLTDYAEGTMCHTQGDARVQFSELKALGRVYFPWNDLKNSSRNLAVYDGAVLDLSLLNWLDPSQVAYPPIFDSLKSGTNGSFTSRDITSLMVNSGQRDVAECLVDVIRVGFVDSVTFGCVASDVVLYVSLVVIIGVVVLRFFMAVLFGWFVSWRIGKFPEETHEQRRARANEIEHWTDDIYRPAPARYRPSVPKSQQGGAGGAKLYKKSVLPTTSRFSKSDLLKVGSPTTSDGGSGYSRSKGMRGAGMRNSPPGSPGTPRASRSSTSLPTSSYTLDGLARGAAASAGAMGACPFPLGDVVPQPPAGYEPFNYPLAHTILLVTAYSESVEGLRTTLDSLSTTDYPNSHKVILVIADGMVRGSGNDLTTPEIVLGMMKEFVIQPADVEPYSYVAIADGHKRHNMAKVYAGFYDYDDNTVERSKQQRVPMLLVAKVGNPAEQHDAKPGNRGKRDSQIVLMSFLQKVMFDERMTTFEYEFFNSLWRATGVSPDRYELVLMVDADTKVFPDSASRMVACMVHDPEIMGLCGETKIANKSDSWVTMIQVFEYYVSHHQTKAFESMFGGVTCLPGCFSMYRIKAPKGGDGYWVPILANPDIVQHYSENVVDTLHKKNLLLLGEDRYLTTLMLRTFPRRKMMFCPQAVCKTIVPDTFSVLLSQRRRWINSTIHNLFELIVVPDLCGVFCFSMRFVIFMELAGTLVLPAAIAFTLYLIVVAIIPGTVKPVVSLVLLALILGIPAMLIVVTSRRFAYLGWMLIYLVSLPIWNFVLPSYSFLHMDDFSWGQTRKIEGETGKEDHGAKEGVFDSSHIAMKRWADWERDRRYKSATQSRDSMYGVDYQGRGESPGRPASHRQSIVSTTDTTYESAHAHSARYPAELSLPAPLAPAANISPASSETSLSAPLPSLVQRIAPSRGSQDYPTFQDAGYEEDADRPILYQYSPPTEPVSQFYSANPDSLQPPARIASPSSSGSSPVSPAPASFASNNPFANPSSSRPSRRGVSLSDVGPVPSSSGEGVRVVQRHSRRSSRPSLPTGSAPSAAAPSAAPGAAIDSWYGESTSGHSGSSASASAQGHLPPGAAPPRHSYGGGA